MGGASKQKPRRGLYFHDQRETAVLDGDEEQRIGQYRTDAPQVGLAPVPNVNPVEAPPAVPVTDPTKIADPADFQDWDELGCQG